MVTKELIVLDGDVARIVEEKVVRTIALGELLRQLQTRSGLRTPVLPYGCIHYSQAANVTKYVVVSPPKIIQCSTRAARNLLIPTPWKIYQITFNADQVGHTSVRFAAGVPVTEPINVYNSWMPNQSGDGGICLGDLSDDVREASGVVKKIQAVILAVEGQSRFNNDYDYWLGPTPQFIKRFSTDSLSDDESLSSLKADYSAIQDNYSRSCVEIISMRWTLWTKDKILRGEDPIAIASSWMEDNLDTHPLTTS
jgi:hypothetical protein